MAKLKIGLDFDDTIVDTTTRIKEYFLEKYKVNLVNYKSNILSCSEMSDERITHILWETDTQEIFDPYKVRFMRGVSDFIVWCWTNNHSVIVQTANPVNSYVIKTLARLSAVAKSSIKDVVFTWNKHKLDTDLCIDDDEKFLQLCEESNKFAIALKYPNRKYYNRYRWEADDYDDIIDIIERVWI